PGVIVTPLPDVFERNGDNVLVEVTATNALTVQSALENLGFVTIGVRPDRNLIEGWLPIDAMPRMDGLADLGLMGLIPCYKPTTDAGAVDSQATWASQVDRVRAVAPGLDGTGVRVGVISDSFDSKGGAATDS